MPIQIYWKWQLLFLNQQKGEPIVENISWSITTTECCQTWRGSNRLPGHQSDVRPSVFSPINDYFQAADTPQMIIVSFENNIDKSNVDLYLSLLKEYNPNGCPAHGSFYIEDDNSDYGIIKQLYGGGHEIGIHSLDGKSPTGSGWIDMYKSKCLMVNIPTLTANLSAIRGTK